MNTMSASNLIVKVFKHNDVNNLRQLLEEATTNDKKTPENRRFIIIEGVYANYGDIAPLKEIVELKEKYKFRYVS